MKCDLGIIRIFFCSVAALALIRIEDRFFFRSLRQDLHRNFLDIRMLRLHHGARHMDSFDPNLIQIVGNIFRIGICSFTGFLIAEYKNERILFLFIYKIRICNALIFCFALTEIIKVLFQFCIGDAIMVTVKMDHHCGTCHVMKTFLKLMIAVK